MKSFSLFLQLYDQQTAIYKTAEKLFLFVNVTLMFKQQIGIAVFFISESLHAPACILLQKKTTTNVGLFIRK